jgi:creatinine amidohydrolase
MIVAEMTWQEYAKFINESVIILPVGSTEQHGPHLPLCVDNTCPTEIAKLVADEINGMLLPTIPYGYKSQPESGGGQHFPGTTSLRGNTLVNLVLDILHDTYRHGGRKFVLFNGHSENTYFLKEAGDLFISEVKDARLMVMTWGDTMTDEEIDELFADCGFPGWDVEHAAVTETSLMMVFAPELVRTDLIVDDGFATKPTYTMYPTVVEKVPKTGVLYKATFASKEKGEKMLKWIVAETVQAIREEFGL